MSTEPTHGTDPNRNPISRDIVLCIIGIVLGSLIAWFISNYFYDLSVSKEVDDARNEAYSQGLAKGRQDGQLTAQRDAQANLPQMVKDQYPTELKNSHDTGYAEGQTDGYAKGLAEGEKKGQDEGHRQANAEQVQQNAAAQGWQYYAAIVDRAAKRAQKVGSQEEKNDLDAELEASVRAFASDARILNQQYKEKAAAFDSIMEQINDALDKKDFETVRRLTIALRESLDVKREQFLSADAKIGSVFDDLAKNAPQ